jgi:hypothetical protein
MLTIWEAGFADSPPVTNQIYVRSIHLSWWNERFEHAMRALSRTSGWEQILAVSSPDRYVSTGKAGCPQAKRRTQAIVFGPTPKILPGKPVLPASVYP